jgi:hypothetical protein
MTPESLDEEGQVKPERKMIGSTFVVEGTWHDDKTRND